MRAVGVRDGTLLFSGQKNGDSIEGQAYIFSLKCGPLKYEVKGEMSEGGRRIVLLGFAPKVNAKCEFVDKLPDTLRFDRMK